MALPCGRHVHPWFAQIQWRDFSYFWLLGFITVDFQRLTPTEADLSGIPRFLLIVRSLARRCPGGAMGCVHEMNSATIITIPDP